jgi:hypothetical protein
MQVWLFWTARFIFFLSAIVLVAACFWKPMIVKYGKYAPVFTWLTLPILVITAIRSVRTQSLLSQLTGGTGTVPQIKFDSVTPIIITVVLSLLAIIVDMAFRSQRKFRFMGLFAPYRITTAN